jgi:hypothetical protein
MNKLLMLCAALVLMSTQAQALCRDDIKNMKPRIERIKNSDPQRYYTAEKWWGRAVEAEPGSELECSNFLERAQKAMTMPLQQADNCNGANAYQARCLQGGKPGGAPGYAAPGVGNFALGGGGGGGGGATPFTPPVSPGSASHSEGR